MIKNGKLLLEGRTDEIVDRYRFAEFFTSNGTTFRAPTRGPHHFEAERKPLARAARPKERRAGLAANARRAANLAHPLDAGRFVRGAGQGRGGRMKRLILDHFRRWWWVLALVAVLEFGLGWFIASRPEDNFEFWGLMLAMWTGAILLSFDLRRGVVRAVAPLPLTARQIGRSWWLATVAIPAIALAALLFSGAGTFYHFHPDQAFPADRLALASLFNLVWLGTVFTCYLQRHARPYRSWRDARPPVSLAC